MALQAEDASWADKHYAEEAEKEWARREAGWAGEAAARAALAAEVDATRKLQLVDRAARSAVDAKLDSAQVAAWRLSHAAAEEAERAAAEARKAALYQQAQATAAQLEERQQGRVRAKQAEYIEFKTQQKTERDYQGRVDALLKVRWEDLVVCCCTSHQHCCVDKTLPPSCLPTAGNRAGAHSLCTQEDGSVVKDHSLNSVDLK